MPIKTHSRPPSPRTRGKNWIASSLKAKTPLSLINPRIGYEMKLFSELSLFARRENRDPDVISNITAPWMWGLLAGLTICLAAVMYWGFYGTLVDTTSGSGIITRAQGVNSVVAKTSGTIEFLDIKPGTPITPNQILGRVYNPEVFFNIHKLQIEQKELQERAEMIQAGMNDLFQKRETAEQSKNQIIAELVQELKENRERMQEMVHIQRELRTKGVISKSDYYNILGQNVSNENSVANTLISQLESMYAQEESRWKQEESHIKLRGELFAKRQEVDLVLKKNQESIWLRSDVNGVVLELFKHPGDPVNTGERIASVSASNDDRSIRTIAYVSASEGKKVRPGMSVYFSPAALPAADHGYIMGVVVSTSLFPVSYESIHAELKNSDFAKTLTREGAVMRVEVAFLPSDQTVSGVKWTSLSGAGATIEPGMVGSLLINTDYRRPISYVLPYLREHVFGIGKKRKE